MTAVSSALAGKVALVTGASSGIGEATAVALAAAGAKVAIAARRADRLEALAARIEKAGGTALHIAADVTSNDDVTAMVDKVVAEWGRLDILVNNAGVMLLSPAAEAVLDDWRRMVELNLLALMGVTKAALPHLRAAKGHIVNVSSVAGRVANPGASGYAATSSASSAFPNRCAAKSTPTRFASPSSNPAWCAPSSATISPIRRRRLGSTSGSPPWRRWPPRTSPRPFSTP
ncbi:SDR family NAD(P)-dependent oxidoreductase [Mesorhizobium sp. M0199]|uniref:SDR family NAD(P)-dependent oxidoreductase n=1 Tax=unclassified Mesorhizobium TaxID=325217 RepID=UPI00333ACD2C